MCADWAWLQTRSLNLTLGGTTRERFHMLGESAIKGITMNLSRDEAVRGDAPRETLRATKTELPVAAVDGKQFVGRPHTTGMEIGRETLFVTEPTARINELVDSEKYSPSATRRFVYFWEVLNLRARLLVADAVVGLLWWWYGWEEHSKKNFG